MKRLEFTSITVLFDVQYKLDGTLARDPVIIGHEGVQRPDTSEVAALDYLAMRALKRCQPIKISAALYLGGWDRMVLAFSSASLHSS